MANNTKIRSFQIRNAVVLMILQDDNLLDSIKGKKNRELREMIEEQFGIHSRQAQRYIKEAREEIQKLKEKEQEEWLEKAVRRRELYIGKSINAKDYRTALQADRDLCELLDLYPDKKIKQENTNIDVDLNKFTEKGLARIARGDDPREVMLDPESVKYE